jgi:16S rRNA (cytosine1402-N4)-methyltransferase
VSDVFRLHEPVLVETVVETLVPCLEGLVIDGTAGLGGHTEALLTADAHRVLAVDIDPDAVRKLSDRFKSHPRVTVEHASYTQLETSLKSHQLDHAQGVLLDLGVSSLQLDMASRGFSFRLDGPIDMRFNAISGRPASDLVNRLPEPALADLLREFGDERRARAIARRIVSDRPHRSTLELAASVRAVFPGQSRINPATRTFQALRIATNDELQAIQDGLSAARTVLNAGGRLVVIAFHSLEDRIVKNVFREWARAGAGEILTPRPIQAKISEIRRNPRARSARLRAFETFNRT